MSPPGDPRVQRLAAPPVVPARIWRLDLATARAEDEEIALWDDADRDRASRMVDPHRRRLVVRRALLAVLAADALGVPVDEVRTSSGDGAPIVAATDGRRLHVSTSHRGDIGLVAIGTRPVGIDLELDATPVPEALDIGAQLFHPDEVAWIGSGPAAVARFLRVWVRKEAVVKLTGEGLGRDLGSFVVRPDEPSVEPVHGADDLAGTVTVALEVAGAVAAVAWRSPEVP